MNKNTLNKWSVLCLFLLVCIGNLFAFNHPRDVKLDMKLSSVTLEEVFEVIEQRSGFSILINTTHVNLEEKVSVDVNDTSVEEILEIVLKNKNLTYEFKDKHIVIYDAKLAKNNSLSVNQQTRKITGVVFDDSGEPIIGANVVVKGTTNGTITNFDGEFSLEVKEGNVLQVSYIGYLTQEVSIEGRNSFNITIHEDTKRLDEVIVVGYGTQKKINLTGSVDQVTSEVFENRAATNVTQALQGAIPNLNISLSDGKPTRSAEFNIRGNTSIGQEGSALILIDGVEGDPAMLNPNDVASVTVLKDAASSSIYGARAVFGVVLITTKNPVKDRTTVSYSANFSVKSPTKTPQLVTDGYTYAKYFNEAWSAWNDYSQTPQNINKTVIFSQDYLAELERRQGLGLPEVEIDENGNYVYYGSTDWYKELYKDRTFGMEHNISVTGSTGKLNYYVTGRYYGQDGLFRYNSDDYDMYNLRAKGSIQVFDWLRVDNNTEYSTMSYHNPLNVGENGGIWRNIADEGHPVSPMFNPDGTLTYSAAYTVGDFWYGKNGTDRTQRVIKNTTSFTAEFLNNKLRVKGDFSFQNTDNNEKTRKVPVPYSRKPGVIEYVGTDKNTLEELSKRTDYLATNIYAEYEDLFADKHYFKGMIGYNYEQSEYSSFSVERNGLIFDSAEDMNMALGQSISTEGGYNKWRILGGFFRANYVYSDRYLLEVNGRLDGSSKFPTNQQYAFFPSVSAGWRVSEESFWHVNENIFSDLKLRVSYGSLGNGNIDPYTFMELLKIKRSERVINGVRPQMVDDLIVVPDGLTWETSTTANLGIDFGSLGGKLRVTGDIYMRKTKDMFTLGKTLPTIFGADVPKGNYADMTTRGFEISLTWRDKFALAQKPFNYEVRFTLSDYLSKIDKYNNPEKDLNDHYVGETLGEIWGYVTEGFFTSQEDIDKHASQALFKSSSTGTWLPGDIKFKDLDENGVIDYGDNTVNNPGDKKIIGNTTPRYTYGINLSADWNNFFFSAFFQGVGKQDWYPSAEAGFFWGQYNRPYNDIPLYHLDNIWREDNPNAYFPRYRGYSARDGMTELGEKQTGYLQKVSYIRMKTLQVGYNLPQSWTSKVRMQNARVYFSGENLFSFSPVYKHMKSLDVAGIGKSDVDITGTDNNYGDGWNYPLLRSYTIGLSVTF